MESLKQAGATLLALTGFFLGGEAWARQNIAIGELSVGSDYLDRNYKQSFANSKNQNDDVRNLYTSPRIRFSTKDVSDRFEFTYAPTFTYDDIDNSSFVGQNLLLLAEKNIIRDWLVRVNDSYFNGEDSLTDTAQQSAAIIPGATVPQSTLVPGAGQPSANYAQQLTDKYGYNRYWRNDFGLSTDYTYAQDSVAGVGFNYGVLRNLGDNNSNNNNGYSDYDRYEGIGRFSYRFDAQWQVVTEASYVTGNYMDANFARTTARANGQNGDVEEYHGAIRTNYSWRPHDVFFGKYDYTESLYEDTTSQDSAIHEVTFGWDHDFSQHLHMTLSAGPSLVTFERSANETGYNAYAGLAWAFQPQATLTAFTSKKFGYQNFDGDQTGLSDMWSSGLSCSYRFSPHLESILSAGYDREDVNQSAGTIRATVANNRDPLNSTREDTYAGLTIRYGFLEKYTLSASYRYADHSESGDDYDEHRVLLTLSATHELLRW